MTSFESAQFWKTEVPQQKKKNAGSFDPRDGIREKTRFITSSFLDPGLALLVEQGLKNELGERNGQNNLRNKLSSSWQRLYSEGPLAGNK